VKINKYKKSNLAIAVSVALMPMLLTTSLSASAAEQSEKEDTTEIIEVTGTRSSLEAALSVKRHSTSIVDAISSEDIGSMPALDLGEALQAIPGVQVNREGERRSSEINLRGLPGGFTRITANGMGFASPARSTGKNSTEQNPFGAFDSQVFDGVTVIKSASADISEGGIAGTVDKKLGKALSKNDNSFAIKLTSRYEELNDSWDPGLLLSGTKHFIEDELAGTFKFATSQQNFRRDSLQNNFYVNMDSKVFSGLDDWKTEKGIAANDIVQYNRDIRQFTEYNEGTRTSFIGGLEWKPTDDLKLGADVLYTQRDMDESTLEIFGLDTRYRGKTGSAITPIGDPFQAGADENGNNIWVVPEYSFENMRGGPGNRVFKFFEEAQGIFLNAQWNHENWLIDGSLSVSDASNEFVQGNYSIQNRAKIVNGESIGGYSGSTHSGAGNLDDYYLNVTGWENNNLDQDFKQPTSYNAITAVGVDGITNVYNAGSHQYRERDNQEIALNAEYKLDSEFLDSIKFGYRGTSEDLTSGRLDTTIMGTHLENLSNDLFTAPHYVNSTNFFGGNAPGFLTQEGGWQSLDNPAYGAALLGDGIDCGDLAKNPLGYCGRTLKDNVTPSRISSIFDSTLDTQAIYLMANFDIETDSGFLIWGNIGVRYVETDFSGTGNRLVDPVYKGSNLDKVGGIEKEHASNDYSNLLPSVNFNIELRDDLILRAAYSETMVRPALASFNPSSTFSQNDDKVTINLPESELEAYTAKSYDLSFEWYNREGSAITFAMYQKTVKGFFEAQGICPEDGGDFGYGPLELNDNGGGDVECLISTPYDNGVDDPYKREIIISQTVNGDEELKVNGYEVSIQQNLDFLPAPWSGFGGIVNYSYVEADEDATLPGISPESYNAIVYWENDDFDIRLAYNYRDEYKLVCTGTTGCTFGGAEERFVKERGQLDFSASYELIENLQLSVRAHNLTEEVYEEYKGPNQAKVGRTNWDGRTFQVGVQYKF